MELKNEFLVKMPVEAAWPLVLDVEGIAPCVPGGELLEKLDERSFKGRVSVKLGPMLLAFEGIAKFSDIDESARVAHIEARGSDKKGRGSAQAKVTLRLEPKGASTVVHITTNLQLSGSVAQIGRASALIEEVSKQIVGEFADNLNRKIDATAAPRSGSSEASKPPAADAAPISGFRFAARVLWGVLVRALAKLTGKPGAKA